MSDLLTNFNTLLSYQLNGFLARQVLDVETDGEHTGKAVLQFLLQGFLLI